MGYNESWFNPTSGVWEDRPDTPEPMPGVSGPLAWYIASVALLRALQGAIVAFLR